MNPPRWCWIKVAEITVAIILAELIVFAAWNVYRRKTTAAASAAGSVAGTSPGQSPNWRGLVPFPGAMLAAETVFGVGPLA